MKVLCVLLLLAPTAVWAESKDDVLTFTPGSQMVGELKRLERGRVSFKTAATDTISIDWDHVTALVSKQQLQIELANGVRHLGHLISSEPQHLSIRSGTGVENLLLTEVVRITPIEETILERLDVDLSMGYSFTKASDIESLDLGLNTSYTTEKYRSSLDAELNTTDDSEGGESTWWTVDLERRRLRENRWFTGYTGKLESNDGLGIDLRTSVGVGGGRYLWQNNELRLGLLAGIQASREDIDDGQSLQDDDESKTTIEGMFGAEFELFRYDEPEIDLSTNLQIIPNLSDTGRVRIEYDLTLQWELMHDFFWQLKFRDSFDSDPPAAGADQNDYTVTTGIVWEL